MPTSDDSRYRPKFTTARKTLDSDHVGRPWSATWTLLMLLDGDQYARSEWRQQDTYPGQLMTDAGVHLVGVLRTMSSDIRSGFAHMRRVNPSRA